MQEEQTSAGKIIICIADILLSLFIIFRVLDLYTTGREFVLCYAAIPWISLIAYLPTALFLGNSILTRVVRTFVFIWFILLATALPNCVTVLSQELGQEGLIPQMRRTLLPIPYLSLLLATVCLLRFSVKASARKERQAKNATERIE